MLTYDSLLGAACRIVETAEQTKRRLHRENQAGLQQPHDTTVAQGIRQEEQEQKQLRDEGGEGGEEDGNADIPLAIKAAFSKNPSWKTGQIGQVMRLLEEHGLTVNRQNPHDLKDRVQQFLSRERQTAARLATAASAAAESLFLSKFGDLLVGEEGGLTDADVSVRQHTSAYGGGDAGSASGEVEDVFERLDTPAVGGRGLGPEEGEECESEAGWEQGGLGVDAVEFAEGVLQDGPDGVDGGGFEEEDEDGGGGGGRGVCFFRTFVSKHFCI